MSEKKKMTPTEKAKLSGEISEMISKATDDHKEKLQILDSVLSFVSECKFKIVNR